MTTANDTDRAYQNGVKAERERVCAILCHGCRLKQTVREVHGVSLYRFEHLNQHGIPIGGCDASNVRESKDLRGEK